MQRDKFQMVLVSGNMLPVRRTQALKKGHRLEKKVIICRKRGGFFKQQISNIPHQGEERYRCTWYDLFHSFKSNNANNCSFYIFIFQSFRDTLPLPTLYKIPLDHHGSVFMYGRDGFPKPSIISVYKLSQKLS